MAFGQQPDGSDKPPLRQLYGRRRGRKLRRRQRDLAARLLPGIRIDLDPAGGPLAPYSLFQPETREIWLEVGFGGGEHLAHQALVNPHAGIIGCEPFMNGVVKLLRQIDDQELPNIRLYCDDARLLLARLPAECLDRVFILYPDPWPKSRHHKRRIINPAVIGRLADTMRDGAELRIATDDEGYLQWILACLTRHREFDWTARHSGDWKNRPENWPRTRYGAKAEAAGRNSWYLRYLRRSRRVSPA